MFSRFRLHSFSTGNKLMSSLLGMIVFWGIFDGIFSYIAPILISEHISSYAEVGMILGSSSAAGAVFDILLSRYVQRPHYRKLYLLFFAICAVVPFILWHATTAPLFLLAMALWGFYFDLYGFGNMDFISRHVKSEDNSREYGFIMIARSVGGLIAPILAGILLSQTAQTNLFIFMWIVLGIAFIFFLRLYFRSKKFARNTVVDDTGEEQKKSFGYERKVWVKLGRVLIFPILFVLVFNLYDATMYTIGPLLAESYTSISPYNGLLMSAYWLPTLFVSTYSQKLSRRWGKKRTAFATLLLAGIPLAAFGLVTNPIVAILFVLISSIFSSLSVPAIVGAFTDYVNESRTYEEEITTIQDFSSNVGYTVGPIMAGFLADHLGYTSGMSVMGIIVILCCLILLAVTPYQINLRDIDAGS